MKIRYREDFDVWAQLKNSSYISSGASKETYEKDGICYKIPLGNGLLDCDSFTAKDLEIPDTFDEFNRFIDTVVYENTPSLVWSLGQIFFEVLIWNKLKELEKQGYDISGFAEIKDFYIDKNGIPVIEQEFVKDCGNKACVGHFFRDKNHEVLYALEELGFILTDFRGENLATIENGEIKCFDFGMSEDSHIYNYDTYDDYCGDGSYYDE